MSWRWALAALLVAAFLLKLVVLFQLAEHPLLQPDAGLDTASYIQLARRVRGGDLALGPGLYYLSPLYIYFLAAAQWAGDSLFQVRLLQITLGTAAIAFMFLAAREWFGTRSAMISAALAAATGVFTFYEVLLLQASLDTFLTASALAALTIGLTRDRPKWICGAGLVFGIQGLNRPNVLIAVCGMLVAMLVLRRLRLAILLVAGIAAGLAPVVVRNLAVSHQLALVSSHGGLNLYIGNNPTATGQYKDVAGVRANIEGQSEDTRRIAEQALGRSLTDSQVSGYFARLAWTWIREHPAAAARLFVRKLALVLNARHQWLDYSYPYYAYDLGTLLRVLIVGPRLLIPLGLMGLVTAAPAGRRAEYAIWASFVPAYAVSVAVFFVAERYRLPIFIPLCVSAGAGVDWVLQKLAAGGVRTLGVPAAVLVTCTIVSNWPFDLNDGRFDERLRLAKTLMNRREYSRAVIELEKAHRIDPGHTVAEFTLGMALVSDGRANEGIPHLRHAVEAGVPINGARYALARAMQASGDADGAARLLRTYQPAAEDNAESCLQVALLALDVGAADVAERYLRHAIGMQPDWAPAREQLGLVLVNTNRCTEAVPELRAALNLGSRNPGVYQGLAACGATLEQNTAMRR